MSHYTGMGPGTINHYQHVGAQLNAHVNNMGGQNLQPAHGHMHQAHPTIVPAGGTHGHPQQFGYNPMINNDMGAVGRAFMRNLFR
jgi:hypothetical protein